MKEAKRYIHHHRVQLSGAWYVSTVRAREATEIAFEEGRKAERGVNPTAPPNAQQSNEPDEG